MFLHSTSSQKRGPALVSSIIKFLHLADNFLEASAHVIRAGRCAVVALHVLEEAQEDGVDGHRVDTKEGMRDEPRADNDDNDWREEIVEGGYVVLHPRDVARKY